MRRVRWCRSGKVCRTRGRAVAAAARLSRHGAAVDVYPCPWCAFWHLTSQPQALRWAS